MDIELILRYRDSHIFKHNYPEYFSLYFGQRTYIFTRPLHHEQDATQSLFFSGV